MPYAFTEHGVAMLANVLNSERAIKMSIFIIKTFVRLRQILATHKELDQRLRELEDRVGAHDNKIIEIITAIRQLMEPPKKETKKIGFVK
jgi:phage regulator Rha-like protein